MLAFLSLCPFLLSVGFDYYVTKDVKALQNLNG